MNKSRFKTPKEIDLPSLNGCTYLNFGVCVMRSRDLSLYTRGDIRSGQQYRG